MEGMILSVLGFIIVLLLGIIGFFIQRLIVAVDAMEAAVNELRVVVGIQQSQFTSLNKDCLIKHSSVDSRLTDHGRRISVNEREINSLKDKLITNTSS